MSENSGGKEILIRRDLHVHLYGCLTAEDLWTIGKDCYKKQESMLRWFASEYKNAWGKTPKYLEYWESDNGLEKLTKDYLFTKANNFSRFQANFNLIIALCPIVPDQFNIQERIIRQVSKFGLEYFEARTVIPFRLTDREVEQYLHGICSTVRDLNCDLEMNTRLVFSLFRDNKLAMKNYKQLRAFIKAYPNLGSMISGIDFAFSEEGFPPKTKKGLFHQFHLDNQKEQALDLLYHVGESFEDKGLISAIRWIWEVNELGATRLGHAIALGVNPENYLGKIVHESCEERLDTIKWLNSNCDILRENGYKVRFDTLRKEEEFLISSNPPYIEIKYDEDYIANAKALQNAVAEILKSKEIVIETCPTSNLRIGQISKSQHHPIKLFHKMGLNYAVCTDDPGIFSTDWIKEDQLAKEIIAI